MPTVVRFGDSKFECWSRVDFENGDPVWISIGQGNIVVKKSNLGLFGAVLYSEKNTFKNAEIAQYLDAMVDKYTTPDGMTNPVLKAFTQAALDSSSIGEFTARINQPKRYYEK